MDDDSKDGHGWPSVPSKRFPGELTLACPNCGNTDVVLQGSAWGSWGNVETETEASIRCAACGRRERYKAKPMRWGQG